jgi:hypothetical protein
VHPSTFNRVRDYAYACVFAFGVVDRVVLPLALDAVVDFGFIGLVFGLLLQAGPDERQGYGCVCGFSSHRFNLTLAFVLFDNADDHSFIVVVAYIATMLTANICFVNFYGAFHWLLERAAVYGVANTVQHTPGALFM